MRISTSFLSVLMASWGCASGQCDDIACSPRLELSLGFSEDGQWSLDFGEYGSCDVVVSAGRIDLFECTDAVTVSSTPGGDAVLLDGTPEMLTVTFAGADEGSVKLMPEYEDQKSGCGSSCLVASAPVRVGER